MEIRPAGLSSLSFLHFSRAPAGGCVHTNNPPPPPPPPLLFFLRSELASLIKSHFGAGVDALHLSLSFFPPPFPVRIRKEHNGAGEVDRRHHRYSYPFSPSSPFLFFSFPRRGLIVSPARTFPVGSRFSFSPFFFFSLFFRTVRKRREKEASPKPSPVSSLFSFLFSFSPKPDGTGQPPPFPSLSFFSFLFFCTQKWPSGTGGHRRGSKARQHTGPASRPAAFPLFFSLFLFVAVRGEQSGTKRRMAKERSSRKRRAGSGGFPHFFFLFFFSHSR